MKKTKSNLQNLLQSLALVFAIIFGMAFACGDGDESETHRSQKPTTKRGSERCSTEEEFKNILIKNYSETFNESDGKFRDTEVEFHSFNTGEPFHYTNSYPIVDAYPAYRVRTNHTKRDFLTVGYNRNILEFDVEGKYIFYIDHHGECVFINDGSKSSQGKSIPYNE